MVNCWVLSAAGKYATIPVEVYFSEPKVLERKTEIEKVYPDLKFEIRTANCQEPREHIVDMLKNKIEIYKLRNVSPHDNIAALIKCSVELSPFGFFESVDWFLSGKVKLIEVVKGVIQAKTIDQFVKDE